MAGLNYTVKTCVKCKVVKPLSEFGNHRSTKDKLTTQCKGCARIYAIAYAEANKDKLKALARAWFVANRDLMRECVRKWKKSNPEKVSASAAKYHSKNKDRINARIAKWVLANRDRKRKTSVAYCIANKEKRKAYDIAWHKANPDAKRIREHTRRALKRLSGGKLSKNISSKLLKLQRGKCAGCGKPLGTKFHLDHIMPLALGGSNIDTNIQLLHPECNFKKHAKHPVDFMQEQGKLI